MTRIFLLIGFSVAMIGTNAVFAADSNLIECEDDKISRKGFVSVDWLGIEELRFYYESKLDWAISTNPYKVRDVRLIETVIDSDNKTVAWWLHYCF